MSRLFGAVRQNGYVVRDIDAALRHWTGVLGVGAFYYFERVALEDFRYRAAIPRRSRSASPWRTPATCRSS